jgi:hypothetical protein
MFTQSDFFSLSKKYIFYNKESKEKNQKLAKCITKTAEEIFKRPVLKKGHYDSSDQ